MTTSFAITPICGFGDVKFHILWTGSVNGMQGWEQEGFGSTRHVPGSNTNVSFLTGMGPLTITYRLFFETLAEHQSFMVFLQTTDTLTVFGKGSELVGREVVWFGEVYKEYDDVLLTYVGNATVSPDGTVECDATFQMQERPV